MIAITRRRPLGQLRLNSLSLSARTLATLGIRREDPRRVWERRAPLTPEAVAGLTEKANIEVESCTRRCFPDSAYAAVGCLNGSSDIRLEPKSFLSFRRMSTWCWESKSQRLNMSRSSLTLIPQ